MNYKQKIRFWRRSNTLRNLRLEYATTQKFYSNNKKARQSILFFECLMTTGFILYTHYWWLLIFMLPSMIIIIKNKGYPYSWCFWLDYVLCYSLGPELKNRLKVSFLEEYHALKNPSSISNEELALDYLRAINTQEIQLLLTLYPPLDALHYALTKTAPLNQEETDIIV